MSIFSLLENTVDTQVALTVSRDGMPETARTVIVIPTASEVKLRQWDWVARNQEYVQRKSGGKVAYVYLPDTSEDGYTYFNRMFFAQIDHEALIVDDRKNNGGQAADYVLDILNRKHLSGWKGRDGLVFDTPAGAIYGPKVMLIDQDAGSGGDYLPYSFRNLGLGKLIGTRTWGGLIGLSFNPLIDGGFVTVPNFRVFSTAGRWEVENQGVAPDVEVPLDPAAVNEGVDNQLDTAIAEVLEQLKNAKGLGSNRRTALPHATGGNRLENRNIRLSCVLDGRQRYDAGVRDGYFRGAICHSLGNPRFLATIRKAYEFKIDLNGNAVEELTYRVTFDERDEHGKQRYTVRRIRGAEAVDPRAAGTVIAQGATDDTVTAPSGVHAFCRQSR